jgi:iron complex outermembrane receptor protein/outer membrane receptor for ferrienterochelin and colicins
LISTARDQFGNKYYININKVHILGTESEINFLFNKNFNIDSNYTYLYAWDETNNREVSQSPRHKFNLKLSYQFDFGLLVSLYGTYVGKQKVYYNVVERIISDYSILNLKLVQKLSSIKSLSPEIFVSINNLLDKDYEEGDGPMPGRSVFAGISVSF